MRSWTTLALIAAGAVAPPAVASAQTPVTRQQAVDSALVHVPRLALAHGDAAVAAAGLRVARVYPNPTITASYSKDPPQYHALLGLPIDYPWVRDARVGAALATRDAAAYRLAFTRAAVRFDAETTYTRALALAAHAALSRRTAQDADSLRRMAERRRDAGDASELDVQLAVINAGQLANVATDDSLASVLALLDLQRLMGLATDDVTIALADTLALPAAADSAAVAATLPVRAARADLEAAERSLTLERRSTIGAPSLEAGFDAHDPTGAEHGLLPTFGLSIPLPLFDLHRGAIALAAANRDRARAELAIAAREADAVVRRATRERAIALAKAARDRSLLVNARRVAGMSLTAYAEGAAALPNVLEAQRNARAALLQYVDDVAAAAVANASVQLYVATPPAP